MNPTNYINTLQHFIKHLSRHFQRTHARAHRHIQTHTHQNNGTHTKKALRVQRRKHGSWGQSWVSVDEPLGIDKTLGTGQRPHSTSGKAKKTPIVCLEELLDRSNSLSPWKCLTAAWFPSYTGIHKCQW